MNKNSIFIVLMILIVLIFTTGCNDKSDDLIPGMVLDEFAQKPDEAEEVIIDERDSSQLGFVDDCDFLSASDVKTICNTDVKMIKLDEMYGVCTFRFDNGKDHYLRFSYNNYGSSDNKERGYNYCLSGQDGVEITEFVCATPSDKNVYVFGDYYALSLGEEYDYAMDKVCTFDQIKELGVLLKEKIY